MKPLFQALLGLLCVGCSMAWGQEAAVLRDLDSAGRATLTKEELGQLLPGAAMSRVTAKGNTHYWKNDPDGSFIISSDNRDRGGRPSTASGKWHISDDGRYCVLIEWKSIDAEEWCRYIVRSGDAYYGAKSDKTGTEKVYKLSISKK
jgi:hypothetical protein